MNGLVVLEWIFSKRARWLLRGYLVNGLGGGGVDIWCLVNGLGSRDVKGVGAQVDLVCLVSEDDSILKQMSCARCYIRPLSEFLMAV